MFGLWEVAFLSAAPRNQTRENCWKKPTVLSVLSCWSSRSERHLRDFLDFRRKLRPRSARQCVDTILLAMAFVVRFGSTTANATVFSGTVRVFATMALKLETNTFAYVEKVSDLWRIGYLIERPGPIFSFLLSSSVAPLILLPCPFMV